MTNKKYHNLLRNLPKQYDLLGYPIKIKLVSPDTLEDNTKNPVWGDWSSNSFTIRISSACRGRTLFYTLLHEHLHALLYVTGVEERLDDETAETLCVLSESLLNFIFSKKFFPIFKQFNLNDSHLITEDDI